MFYHPSPTQEKMLRSLARYKFLTISQMLRLGVAKHQPNVSKNLKTLRDRKLVATQGFSMVQRDDVSQKSKRVESIFYLTPKGAKEVMERLELPEEKIKFPKQVKTLFSNVYFHRKYAIDCEISANISALEKGYEVTLFDRDFDKVGSNRKGKGASKTKIQTKGDNYIIPDANFILSNQDDEKLFTLELHNERASRAIATQLTNHTFAVENGSVGLKYGIERLHRVLNVFIEENKMNTVLEKLQKAKTAFREMEMFFFFKTLENAKIGNFYDNWLNLDGNKVNLL